MSEILENIIKQKISADHLLYVSMKYTKTCDVMINLIKRWKSMIDYAFEGLLESSKEKKKIKEIPSAPKKKIDLLSETFKDTKEVTKTIKIYKMFKLIDTLKKKRANEFRKGVCLTVRYRGNEIPIDLDKLKEYSEILERFINYTKLFLTTKK